jgi:hypothetical protein
MNTLSRSLTSNATLENYNLLGEIEMSALPAVKKGLKRRPTHPRSSEDDKIKFRSSSEIVNHSLVFNLREDPLSSPHGLTAPFSADLC